MLNDTEIFSDSEDSYDLYVHKAAISIQRAWRSHIDTSIFKFYRNLISFKSCGTPQKMLACINPIEAKFLENGSHTHVKFRLCGSSFPPKIIYKVFTHAPIQDMCANSPKDYTDQITKLSNAYKINNRNVNYHSTKSDNHVANWYKRVENNGWRCVSEQIIFNNFKFSESKKLIFHHDRNIRRTEKCLNKRRKKICWLINSYKNEKMKNHYDVYDEMKDTANKMVIMAKNETLSNPENYLFLNINDKDVDSVLEWTKSLNFEKYLQDWNCIGTTFYNVDDF